jgi:hypothetical protein
MKNQFKHWNFLLSDSSKRCEWHHIQAFLQSYASCDAEQALFNLAFVGKLSAKTLSRTSFGTGLCHKGADLRPNSQRPPGAAIGGLAAAAAAEAHASSCIACVFPSCDLVTPAVCQLASCTRIRWRALDESSFSDSTRHRAPPPGRGGD